MPHQPEALDGAMGEPFSMMEPSTNLTATNPWRDLAFESPYALASDRLIVVRFDQKARPDHQIHLDLLPEPFLGRRTRVGVPAPSTVSQSTPRPVHSRKFRSDDRPRSKLRSRSTSPTARRT